MITKKEDFYQKSNVVRDITEKDYQKLTPLLDAVKAFTRSTYQNMYILDYYKKNFLYVSDNLSRWCNLSSEQIKDIGYEFYLKCIPQDELEILLEVTSKALEFLGELPVEERSEYALSFEFHIRNGNKLLPVRHHTTPLMLTKDGSLWLTLCTLSPSSHESTRQIILKKDGLDFHYEYSLEQHAWTRQESVTLTTAEHDILLYAIKGYTVNEMAQAMYKSTDSIKAYKKVLFKKLQVKSMTEAISYALNNKLV